MNACCPSLLYPVASGSLTVVGATLQVLPFHVSVIVLGTREHSTAFILPGDSCVTSTS